MKTRRHILTCGLLTVAGAAAAPLSGLITSAQTRWFGQLEEQLGGYAAWMRRETGADGVAELHCGVADVTDFAHRLPRLADEKTRVRAAANQFALTTGGQSVRVVIHLLSAAVAA